MADFNPYVEWLDIAADRCPPNYFDLLGISPGETDVEVIEAAFDKRCTQVRQFQAGPDGGDTQRILGELSQAKSCLIHKKTRNNYELLLETGFGKLPVKKRKATDSGASGGQAGEFQIHSNDTKGKAGFFAQIRRSRRLPVYYVLSCLVVVLGLFLGKRFFFPPTDQSATVEAAEGKEQGKAPRPRQATQPKKKIVNLISSDKGILPEADNHFMLNASNVKIEQSSPIIVDSAEGPRLQEWKDEKSVASWSVWIEEPGYYEAIVKYLASTNGEHSRLVLGPAEVLPKKVKMRSSDSLESSFEEEFVLLFRKPGSQTLQFMVEGETGDFQLVSITLRPNRIK